MKRVLLKTGKIASLILLGTVVVAGVAAAAVTNCPGTANYDPNTTMGTQCYSRIALYAGAHTAKSVTTCTTWTPNAKGIPCPDGGTGDWNVDWTTGTSSDVYLAAAMAPNTQLGIAGMSCGIQYNNGQSNSIYCGGAQVAPASDAVGVDVFGWILCTTGLEFTNGCDLNNSNTEWPESGGGDRITWNATSTDCGYSTTPGDPNTIQAIAGAFYLYAYSQDLFEITANNNLLSGAGEFQVADCNAAVSDLIFPTTAGQVAFGSSFSGYNPCNAVPTKETTWGKIKTQY